MGKFVVDSLTIEEDTIHIFLILSDIILSEKGLLYLL